MNNNTIQSIVLAAGKSSRFNTGNSKLVEKICGREMIMFSLALLDELKIPITVVTGHQASDIQKVVNDGFYQQAINYSHQKEQKGTGHALLSSKETWSATHILVLNGDMPLVTKDIIQQLITTHTQSDATISFVIAHNEDPSVKGYGRIVKENNSIKIVEENNFAANAHDYCCVNAGIYLFKRTFLEKYITTLHANEETQEYYITDLISIADRHGYKIETVSAHFDQIRGINTLKELWTAEQIKRSELIMHWMSRGVRFYAAQAAHVDVDVSIGSGTYIGCGVHVLKGTTIGKNCSIEEFSLIKNAAIGDDTVIRSHSIIENSSIASHSNIGPFAHIHTESSLQEGTIIGNFVEIKKSCLGSKSKAKHLSYLGDAIIGENVNIGAGTVTCNHNNGHTKNTTIIEDNAYIGSNTSLVAPITVGSNAFAAAGSVITKNVPQGALAIARSHQINKLDYVAKLRERFAAQENRLQDKKSDLSFWGALKTHNDTINGI